MNNFNPASALIPTIIVANAVHEEEKERIDKSKKRRNRMSTFITIDRVDVVEHIFKGTEITNEGKITLNTGTIVRFYESEYSTEINPITYIETDDRYYFARGLPQDIQRKIDEANEKVIKK